MKATKYFIQSFVVMLTLCLSACETPVQDIAGEYSFSVSGRVTKDASSQYELTNEMGTLEIAHLSDSTYKLFFDTQDGIVYTTKATLSNNQLDLRPFERSITLVFKSQESSILGDIIQLEEKEYYRTEVYGSGTIYGNTIEFNLQYAGEELNGNHRITGNRILMIARKNVSQLYQ